MVAGKVNLVVGVCGDPGGRASGGKAQVNGAAAAGERWHDTGPSCCTSVVLLPTSPPTAGPFLVLGSA